MTYTGHCLCGQVSIEIKGDVTQKIHCYCSMCQRAHGSDHSEWGICLQKDIAVIGAEYIESYESSPGVMRRFCRRCGSNIQFHDASEFSKTHFAFAWALLAEKPESLPLVEYFKPA
ncbi:MAG: GFA family protein [Reinekea sp.]|nr:GFA family protein [Reinekea sp.]